MITKKCHFLILDTIIIWLKFNFKLKKMISCMVLTAMLLNVGVTFIHDLFSVCSLLKKGVFGIIGVSDASALSTIQSYSNTFKVPFISLSMTQNSSNHGEYQLFIRPVYTNGLLDVIINYGWDRILYVYENDEGKFDKL